MFQDDDAKLRRGRISFIDRAFILNALGDIVKEKYQYFLKNNHQGYRLNLIYNALQVEPDLNNFENKYYLDAGSEELTNIANYFEYGTGLNNSLKKSKGRRYIKPKNNKFMKFSGSNEYEGKTVFAKAVRGVRPIFAMTKAVKDVQLRRKDYQRKIRIYYGLGIVSDEDSYEEDLE